MHGISCVVINPMHGLMVSSCPRPTFVVDYVRPVWILAFGYWLCVNLERPTELILELLSVI